MKRIVQMFFLSAVFAFFAFLGPKAAHAALIPYGMEGGNIGTHNNFLIAAIYSITGACAEGSTPAAPIDDINYMSQSADSIAGQYFAGGCPESMTYNHSTIAGLNNTVFALYNNPPASTQAFVMDLGQTLGFIPRHAYAQGIGFSGLSPLLPIWKAFRNIAYALLAVILIVVGFMVMLRKKIDPKTVVTVQNAIPRIVVALLLVTFSYAIVGLMIDLMYFVIVLGTSLIVPAVGGSLDISVYQWIPNWSPSSWIPHTKPTDAKGVINIFFNGGIGNLIQFFFSSGFQSVDDIGKLLIGNIDPKIKYGAGAILGILGFLLGGGGVKGAIIGSLASGPPLLYLIVLIVLLFGIIRLIFMLVDAYINIIISLLFSPFQLMLEAIPGTNSFNSWFRWLLAKVITFPLTAILLMVAAFLTSQSNATKLWAPPLISSGDGVTGIAGFVGLGMLLVIPTVVGSIQKALKAEPFIPGGVGAVIGPLGSGVGQLFQLGYQYSFISSSIRHKPDARSPMQTIREGSQKGFDSLTGQGEAH